MKIRLIVALVLVLGNFQTTVCAAAEEARNREYFQEHKEIMKPVLQALVEHFMLGGLGDMYMENVKKYQSAFAGKNCAANSHVTASEQSLRKAFSLCPSNPRKQELVEFSECYLDRAKLLAKEAVYLSYKMSMEAALGYRFNIMQRSLTTAGMNPHFASIVKLVSAGQFKIEVYQKESLDMRDGRIERQQARVALCSRINTKKIDQGECKECE